MLWLQINEEEDMFRNVFYALAVRIRVKMLCFSSGTYIKTKRCRRPVTRWLPESFINEKHRTPYNTYKCRKTKGLQPATKLL
jgi:hypothetical protein